MISAGAGPPGPPQPGRTSAAERSGCRCPPAPEGPRDDAPEFPVKSHRALLP